MDQVGQVGTTITMDIRHLARTRLAGRVRCWVVLNIASNALLVTLACGSLMQFSCSARGIQVRVANKSNSPIRDVMLTFGGERMEMKSIATNTVSFARFVPKGESRLELTFSDAIGRKHTQPIHVYICQGLYGSIDITVEPDMRVSWVDAIR